jgi:hypothetical protein
MSEMSLMSVTMIRLVCSRTNIARSAITYPERS